MTHPYVLSRAAETDLREITRYTASQWGSEQARTYAATLAQCAEELTTGNGRHRDMGALYPDLRMVHCQHHYIFGLPRPAAPALVIAILHERMDVITRLKARL